MNSSVFLLVCFAFIWTCSAVDGHDSTGYESEASVSVIKALVERMNDMEYREVIHIKALEELKREHQHEIEGLKKELLRQKDQLHYFQRTISKQAGLLSKLMRRVQPRSTPVKNSESKSSAAISVSSAENVDKKQKILVENTVNRIRRADNEVTVAFTAGLTHSVFHAGPHQNIVFDHVETNVGNGYNPHHGVFIAPVSGLYFFYSSILTEHNEEVLCQIVVNGVHKGSIYGRGTDGRHDQGSQALIVSLQQGDDVAVQNLKNDHAIWGSTAEVYSTFSGFLLQQSFPQSGTIIG